MKIKERIEDYIIIKSQNVSISLKYLLQFMISYCKSSNTKNHYTLFNLATLYNIPTYRRTYLYIRVLGVILILLMLSNSSKIL